VVAECCLVQELLRTVVFRWVSLVSHITKELQKYLGTNQQQHGPNDSYTKVWLIFWPDVRRQFAQHHAHADRTADMYAVYGGRRWCTWGLVLIPPWL